MPSVLRWDLTAVVLCGGSSYPYCHEWIHQQMVGIPAEINEVLVVLPSQAGLAGTCFQIWPTSSVMISSSHSCWWVLLLRILFHVQYGVTLHNQLRKADYQQDDSYPNVMRKHKASMCNITEDFSLLTLHPWAHGTPLLLSKMFPSGDWILI